MHFGSFKTGDQGKEQQEHGQQKTGPDDLGIALKAIGQENIPYIQQDQANSNGPEKLSGPAAVIQQKNRDQKEIAEGEQRFEVQC